MPEVTSPINLHVSSPDGIYSCYLEAGVPSIVPEVLMPHVHYALMERGARVEGNASETGPTRADKVAAITEAYRSVLAKNQPELLDAGGIPRQDEIEAIVGFRTNKKDREEAWAEVEG